MSDETVDSVGCDDGESRSGEGSTSASGCCSCSSWSSVDLDGGSCTGCSGASFAGEMEFVGDGDDGSGEGISVGVVSDNRLRVGRGIWSGCVDTGVCSGG